MEQKQRYTVADYFRIDAESPERFEFCDGQIIAMAGGSEAHSLITANIIGELRNRLKGTPCRVYDSNLRVRAAQDIRYTYPDALVVCGKTEFDPVDAGKTTIINARVIVEVLSPSTERSDRGEKFKRYIMSPSFEEYVLVSQDKPQVETILRQPDGTWSLAYFDGLEAMARLRSIKVDIPMTEVYSGVTFPSPESRE
jgi:Uma2 family endonuclease